jgi:hypothetical protein
MQVENAQTPHQPGHRWQKSLLRWCMAFFIPFLIAFGLLVSHEQNKAYDDIQRNRMFGEIQGQPGDDKEAWKMATVFTAVIATPVGLLGLGGYGCFIGCQKLLGRSKAGDQ